MSGDGSRLGSAREEAERLVATGLGVASTLLHGVETNRQLRALAEQVFTADRVHDLAAGLAGFVNGPAGGTAQGASAGGTAQGASAGGTAQGASAGAADGQAAGAADGAEAGSSAPGSPPPGLSTGSADCCVCPVCRLIASLRDPSPDFAERLASATGDVAVGIAGLLRVLGGAVPRPGHGAAGDDPWHAATAAEADRRPAHDDSSAGGGVADAESAGEPAPASRPPVKKVAVKKVAAKKAAAQPETPAKKTAVKKTAVKKTVAKKVAGKKAVRKAVPRDPGDGAT